MAVAEQLKRAAAALRVPDALRHGRPDQGRAQSLGQRVRVYTPYGQLLPGMAYLVRRLLENTSNDSFLRARLRGGRVRGGAADEPARAISDRRARGQPTASQRRQRRPAGQASTAPRPLPQRAAHRLQPRGRTARAMQAALDAVATRVRPDVPAGHRRQAGRDGRETIDSREPVAQSAGRRQGRRRRPSEHARSRRSRRAEGASTRWRDTDRRGAGRAACAQAAERFRERRFELAAWIVYESGKPWREADADVAEAIDFCEYYAREMLRLGHAAAPRRAGRGERLLLRAARRRRRHRPVELPARDPHRHGGRGPRHRQHGHHEAGRAVGASSARS